ncbi:hypothetical protein [Actinomadura rupiterrae]|nr:hypothetical protein [Actinomadura rupiterrae]MCP2343477.1 hypothetical protein [Actinomadura rupiterrae]
MVRSLTRLSDRVLDRLLPSTSAKADTCWRSTTGAWCCIVAGHTYCRF